MEKFKVRPIETERFNLRAVTVEDAKDMFVYASDAETVQYTTFLPHKDLDETIDTIKRFFINKPQEGKPESFAIVDKKTDRMIGTCDFWPLEGEGVWEFGYIINKEYWGQGVMTEVAKAVLDYAFENFDVEIMKLKHVVDNVGSGKVALKLGFKQLGVVKDGAQAGLGVVDAMTHEMRKEDHKND